MNILKRKINKLINKLLIMNRSLYKDSSLLLSNTGVKDPILFDVGAYKGKWIDRYFKHFPKLKAYLFEPSLGSYNDLKNKFVNNFNVKLNQLALSNKTMKSRLYINKKDYTNSLLEINPIAERSWIGEELTSLGEQSISIDTIDNFCCFSDIKKINLLKLDVQGLEANVLRGAEKMLKNNLIDLIILEVITTPTYTDQSKPSEVFELLEQNNYSLFGIYDIIKANYKSPILQFDVIYISSRYKELYIK